MSKNYNGIVEISNKDYHAEKEHLSSSNLKLLLKDPGQFYKEKILGQKKPVESSTQSNYDEGTYAHSLLLEPEKIEEEFRFYSGWTKRGKEWDQFLQEHKDYVILSKPQKVRVERWVQKAQQTKVVMNLLKGGKPELTLFGELFGIPIKVRTDYINETAGYILDIKTTSYPTDLENFKYTALTSYQYHLSAALYLMMMEKHFNRTLDFYFLVLGKSTDTCDVYKLSQESREKGEVLIRKAIDKYKQCLESGKWTNEENKKVIEKSEEYEIQEI